MSEPANSASAEVIGPVTFRSCIVGLATWVRKNPSGFLALLAFFGVLYHFFCQIPIYLNGRVSAGFWMVDAWKPESNQEHSKLVIPIILGLVWYHRNRLRAAIGPGSNWGLISFFAGIALFLVGARMLEGRYAVVSIPFLAFGALHFLFGFRFARILLFTCAFFIFAVPMGAVEQATNRLQFIITGAVDVLSNLIGIKVQAVGTTLTAADGTFNFEIAEGCSGVRSIIAMAMLTSVFVHVTQKTLWKKLVIFAASGLFAIIGNIGRIFTVILVAKFYDTDVAAGIYHDYSGFVFFPIALTAMAGFAKLLNPSEKTQQVLRRSLQREPPEKEPKYDY